MCDFMYVRQLHVQNISSKEKLQPVRVSSAKSSTGFMVDINIADTKERAIVSRAAFALTVLFVVFHSI